MIKGKWQGIVFVVLILLLAIGLSTVALNEQSEEEVKKVHKMSIALVNEDIGTEFNESGVNFGDEFSNRMNTDQPHDWYVVSRGVAESGFERNVYDMMIVIPNDFSERALSIDEDAPEQVALEYKINATGHEDVRAEAEKSAGEILTNFNKELIDVFFVSIIGNLQEAQDHIVDIIEKEKEYTDEYTANIFNPLDNFTNQFDQVQQHTDMSKNNYNQLDDVLHNFESSLSDKAETSAEYDEDLAEALQQGESFSDARSSFTEQFDHFYNRLTEEESLEQLSQANGDLYHRFQDRDSDEENKQSPLQNRIQQLNNHFNALKKEVEDYQELLDEELEELPEVIKKSVTDSFDDDAMEDMKLIDLIEELDENILENIHSSIAMLPTDAKEIDDLVLPESTKTTLKNVILVSEAFEEDDEFTTNSSTEPSEAQYSLLEDPFKEVKASLLDEGIEVTDTLKITDYKNENFTFALEEPKDLKATNITINGESVSSSEGDITLEPEEGEDDLTVTMKATFVFGEDFDFDTIDLFQPVKWNWTIHQSNEETETTPPEDTQSQSEEKIETESDQAEEKVETVANEEGGNDDESPDDEKDEENGNETDPEDPPEPEQPEEPTVTEKTVHQFYWNQSVQTAFFDSEEFTGNLIEEAVVLYEAIDSLSTLYNVYFGFDLSKENEEFTEELDDKGLVALSEDDSLYYLIHKKEIKEIIEKRISDDISNSVLDTLDTPLTVFQKDVKDYQKELDKTQSQSSNLAEALEDASKEAERLNTNVSEVLEEVDAWKNTSDDLVADQIDLQSQDSEVQTALLQLDSGFKPILSTSESLVEQAQSNFDSTEQVYETLDSIDEQADDIQQSGVTLISNANNLASKFSEKAAEDMDFAENFNEVLDNSRIGDRQNEDLYSFLSNPVETKNTGIIQETQSFTPYFVVFIMTVISFFTAYVLSNHKGSSEQVAEFETDQTFIQKNIRPMLMTGGIGLIEGVLIGITSFILLDIPQNGAFSWVALITTMMLGMVLIATYALRQLKMIGMFLLLVVFSMYLLLTKSLGFQFGGNEAVHVARKISPLQQLENWIHGFIEGTMSTGTLTIAFIILMIAVIIGLALNVLIIDNRAQEAGVDDERTKEAN